MVIRIVLFMLLGASLASSIICAQVMYKIIDEKGRVTFSQYPPDAKTVEDLSVEVLHSQGAPIERVVVKDSFEYCGDMRLPESRRFGGDLAHLKFAEFIIEEQSKWRQELKLVEAALSARNDAQLRRGKEYSLVKTNQRERKNAEKFARQQDRDALRVRTLRCAIRWGDKQRDESHLIEDRRPKEVDRLMALITKLKKRMVDACGSKPIESNDNDAIKKWSQCMDSYQKDIDKVNGRIAGLQLQE